MPPAARVSDPTSHPGTIAGPGVATVLIEKMPASVVGDTHSCAFAATPQHPPSTMVTGSATVLIGGRPAVRLGDAAACSATVVAGAPTVLIGG
ncbi:MAG: PAAR domain-containing protein [Rhizobacter sp.]